MELLFSEVTLFGLLTANVFDADTEFDPLFVVAAATAVVVVVVIVAVVPCD